MKSFKCAKVENKDINEVFLEVQKAYKEQKARNDDAYRSLYSYIVVLQGYIERLDSALSSAEYYRAYLAELCKQNNV